MMVDGVRLIPGKVFGRQTNPSKDGGVYLVSAGKWGDSMSVEGEKTETLLPIQKKVMDAP